MRVGTETATDAACRKQKSKENGAVGIKNLFSQLCSNQNRREATGCPTACAINHSEGESRVRNKQALPRKTRLDGNVSNFDSVDRSALAN